MDDQYYIRSRDRVQGPYTPSRLRELAGRGQFSRYHHVSTDRVNWERASAHPELFPDVGPQKVRETPPKRELAPIDPIESDSPTNSESNSDDVDNGGDAPVQEWYYTSNGTEHAEPVTFPQLQLLASTGQLTFDDQVWIDGMPNWTPASTVPDLFPKVNAPEEIEIRVHDNHEDGPQPTAPMAVASFVLGLLGISLFFFVGSILAIVFGHIALKQIRDSRNKLGGRGLAITGLILGYIVLAISIMVGMIIVCISVLGVAAASV